MTQHRCPQGCSELDTMQFQAACIKAHERQATCTLPRDAKQLQGFLERARATTEADARVAESRIRMQQAAREYYAAARELEPDQIGGA